ncbi:PstS family phosphate ABC transporter substrate-binding protein [Geobacter sp. SVR]|uniref:PstS family phosphate ABC transporter substrate-binding protein n=1 Tax=Geobacter sp. SVR TaxID=2495594 RepID=UPI00143F02C1|nr:phosphate ABC transporter substrate-binding protein [Geobacter sp. SVR]BCS55926.1 phosphate ABC transporter substrate-binding protein [Geobacter sp. SVR]GCF84689.1 phosphate ABC transporter substrate-binding protein [Geobacter sp. SVR]
MLKKTVATALLLLSTVAAAHAEKVKVDAKIPTYKSTAGVSGNLNSVGSDTLNNLMTYWAEGFKKKYPSVNIQIEGKGSGTAPPALIAGTSQLGPMSREMKSSEIEQFEKKFGYKPTKIGVALDSLAVFVNKDNPIKSLSLDEVDAIFSKTHKRGLPEATTWGQLGVTGKLAAMPISLYGRNSASGTYGYFKEHALKNGDYKPTVKEQPGSASVVEGVARDLGGIGYSGIGYATSGVRAVPLSDKKGGPVAEATYQNVLAGKYPMSRMLYIYVAKKPGEPLPKVVEEFLKYVLSKEGQEIVVKDGYDPLTANLAADQLKHLK